MRGVCVDLDAELVEFNGETDHLHLLVAYPTTLAITSGRRPTSPSPAEAHPLSIIKQYIDQQARPL